MPLPFSRIVFLWGEPIYINSDMDEKAMEDLRLHLEKKLIELTEEADRIVCGR